MIEDAFMYLIDTYGAVNVLFIFCWSLCLLAFAALLHEHLWFKKHCKIGKAEVERTVSRVTEAGTDYRIYVYLLDIGYDKPYPASINCKENEFKPGMILDVAYAKSRSSYMIYRAEDKGKMGVIVTFILQLICFLGLVAANVIPKMV